MSNLAMPLFRSVMSALMVSGLLALAMPFIGIEQPTKVLFATFVGVAVLLSAYELIFASKDT